MARPLKQGLDYFPLDVDIDQDDKIQLIEARHDMMGFAIVTKLLMRIYKESYFYSWTEKEQLLFSKKNNVDINVLNDVVNDCIKYELFNPYLFEKYNILTSHGIQKRYFEASSRRKCIDIVEEYLLITVDNDANVNKIKVNVNKKVTSGLVNNDISTQRKGKEIESKVKYAEFVRLTENEYKKLVDEHCESATKEMVQILNNYKGSMGKEYKSDYRAILSWVVDRYNKDLTKQNYLEQSLKPIYKEIVLDDSRGED